MSDTVAATVTAAPAADVPVTGVTGGAASTDAQSSEPMDGESFEAFKARTEAKTPKKKAEDTKKASAEESSDDAPEGDAETAEPKEETAEAEFKPIKLKDGDTEIEITSLDQLTKIAQKGVGADRKFQEAATIRKQAEKLVNTLKDNPLEVMKHPALREKMLQAAQELIYEQIQHEQMSDEERSRIQEREELEKYRRSEQERKQAEQERGRSEMRDKYRADYEKQFIEALNTGGIPKSDWAVTRMAQYMRQALQQGMSNITPADVVSLVKRDWQQAQSELYGQLDGDKLIEMLGSDVAEKIRRADVAKLTAKKPDRPQVQQAASEPKVRRRFSSPDQMLESL